MFSCVKTRNQSSCQIATIKIRIEITREVLTPEQQ